MFAVIVFNREAGVHTELEDFVSLTAAQLFADEMNSDATEFEALAIERTNADVWA